MKCGSRSARSMKSPESLMVVQEQREKEALCASVGQPALEVA